MRTVDVIARKRNGAELTPDEIRYMIQGVVSGEVPDYQLAAWLMAVYFQGMSFAELATLTDAMVHSGEVYDLSAIPGRKVDKHSTGGVGDKVSLALAPLVAAAGVPVPMMSGRALGHTGGTLDKLESIPGFNVHLSVERYRRQIERIGVAMIGQSETIAPADRLMYALRDVTATVESIPLIAASIMSKKIAAGPDALVMDVKTGSGAFMSDPADAEALAKTLVAVGRETGMPVVALLTDMNQPLGRAVGNAVEVVEAIEFLQGGGPADFREVVLALSAEMLVLGERAESTEAARSKLETCIEDGSAMARFAELIEAQEGDAGILENPAAKLGIDALEEDAVTADRDGFIAEFDTQRVGIASMILGAGRRTVNDAIDHAVGLYVEKKPGDRVRRGETIFRLLYRDSERRAAAVQCLEGVVRIEEEAPDVPSLLKSRIDASILTDEES